MIALILLVLAASALILILLLILPAKGLLFVGLSMALRLRARSSLLLGASLGQLSEFGLIVGAVGVAVHEHEPQPAEIRGRPPLLVEVVPPDTLAVVGRSGSTRTSIAGLPSGHGHVR